MHTNIMFMMHILFLNNLLQKAPRIRQRYCYKLTRLEVAWFYRCRFISGRTMAFVGPRIGVDIMTCQFPPRYTVAALLGTLRETQRVETVTKQTKT